MVLFTASRRNNFVGGTCALPSALLRLVVYEVYYAIAFTCTFLEQLLLLLLLLLLNEAD